MDTKPQLPAVELAERTDPGRDPEKQVNEDACGHRETPFGHLCVLCDGMGGHQNGREASNLALETIFETFEAAPAPADGTVAARGRELLEQAIVAANRRVFELGGTTTHGRPGSTVVALLLHAGGAEVAHVGDSRCYMICGSQIFQITKDHSLVQKLVEAGVLTPAQAAVHPDANQILRALGSAADVEVEVRAQTITHVAGDTFVLCSDGLSDLVEPPQILEQASSAPPAQAVGQLVDLANARGGHDNVTVVILRARESAVATEGGGPPPARAAGVAPTIAQTLVAAPVFAAPVVAQPTSQPTSAPTSASSSGGHPQVPAASSQPAPAAVASAPTLPLEIPPVVDVAKVPGALGAPPPAPTPPKRRISPAVAVGVVLAAVGVGAAGFALYVLLDPGWDAKQVAPFALSGTPFASSRPPAALVPALPEVDPATSAAVEAGPPPAPLPSLVPSPPPRHRR